MRTQLRTMAIVTSILCVGCGDPPPEVLATPRPAIRGDAVCVPVWDPTWQQGSGANNYWVEYVITGGTVASASLELPSGSRVTLASRYGKWVGGSSFIATGTQVIVHARNSLGQDAQTLPFPYLTNRTPLTDPCAGTVCTPVCTGRVCGDDGCGGSCGSCPSGQACSSSGQCVAGCVPPAWNAAWLQGSGANPWWIEYAITGSTVASASVQLPNGSRVTLSSRYGKWVGGPPAAIARGTLVVVHATNTLGQSVQTTPFAYLDVTAPQTATCSTEPPPPSGPLNVPLMTPSINGYTLSNAFPGVSFSLPAAIAWPTTGGPFVLERVGRIVQVTGTTRREVVGFTSRVRQTGEAGALGLALHPAFGDGTGPRPFVYVWYNASNATQRLSRFTWNPSTRLFGAELVMLEQAETATLHNAGHLQFGPDGFLYFGNGDDNNPANHQTLSRALFAGLFCIDVDLRGGGVSHAPPRSPAGGFSTGYFIPNDNPFVGVPGAMEEFYALGVRNPFGWSFDQQTGALWAGDVGDTLREEVNLIVRGGNYQWPFREGELVRQSGTVSLGTSRPPAFVYSHAEMADLSAILGGFIYRGSSLPALAGKYVYSDWPSGRIWALDVSASPVQRTSLVDNKRNAQPMAMAQDNNGEIYLLQLNTISRLVRDTTSPAMPPALSLTGLFSDVATLSIDSSFVPYAVNSPLWSDGAVKTRWIRVPAGQRVTVNTNGTLSFPVGTMFVKHFELPTAIVPVGRTRRLETRVLVVASDTVYGVTYRWNAQGTDAQLVTEPTEDPFVDSASGQSRSWHHPSLSECWACHRPQNRVLGFNPGQLALTEAGGTRQLDRLTQRGVFAAGAFSTPPVPLTQPSDTSASLESRSLSYLAANCGPCHHQGESYLGGGPTWNASPGVPLANRGLINAPHHNDPVASLLGLPNAPLISPGNPGNSILLARMKSSHSDLRMPPLARNLVDAESAALIEAWIRSL